MDFGKPPDPASVDWNLPADGELTGVVLTGHAAEAPRAWIGSTAWGERSLVGEVYPPGTKSADYLAAYGRQFNAIELNATFYRSPDYRQVRRWSLAAPEDFRFCPKVPKAISQRGDLAAGRSTVLDFAKAVQHFETKLGPCFLQLPQSFATSSRDVLDDFLDRWPPSLPLAVELRHPSWFGPSDEGLDALADLHARGTGTVITDVGGRRDVAHMQLTTTYAFVRWVGNDHPSDGPRLEQWVDRLEKWFAAGLQALYFMVHQPDPVVAARTARRFAGALNGRGVIGLSTRGPRLLGSSAAGGPGESSGSPTLFGVDGAV